MDRLLSPGVLKDRSKSCMSEVDQGLHIKTVCFEFGDSSSICSQTRVFTSMWETNTKLTPGDLENRSRSCMSELVQRLHIRNLLHYYPWVF